MGSGSGSLLLVWGGGGGNCVSSRGTNASPLWFCRYSTFSRDMLLLSLDVRNHRSNAGILSRKLSRGRIAGRSGLKHFSRKLSMVASWRVSRGRHRYDDVDVDLVCPFKLSTLLTLNRNCATLRRI